MGKLNIEKQYDDFKKKLKENPSDFSLWIDYATFLDEEFNNQNLAIQALEKAYILSPSIHVKLKIGILYKDKGEINKGIAIFKSY